MFNFRLINVKREKKDMYVTEDKLINTDNKALSTFFFSTVRQKMT